MQKTNKKSGYKYVELCKNGKQKTHTVHRLVAEAFLPNLQKKPEVNHKWGIKSDNRASELEWNTRSENMKHAYKTGLNKITKKQRENAKRNGKKTSKTVLQYDLQGNLIKEWESTMEVERQLKIDNANISACCRRKYGYKTAGGYIWRYKDAQ